MERGDGPKANEFAQLKGEYEALHEISVKKSCTITSKSPEEMFSEYAQEKKEAKKKRKRKKEQFIL